MPRLVDPRDALEKHFGFREFLDTQEQVVSTILSGRDTLVVMPTGGGKSLCYQLPAVILPGLTVVVSPLIALMKDQVDGLIRKEIPATYINSSIGLAEQRERLRQVREGTVKLLYVSPERFRAEGFFQTLRGIEISLFAVDEAHCLSMWGHDFRPDYFRLGRVVEELGRPQVAAFTATATREVREDIIQRLGLKPDHSAFVAGFARPNLKVSVLQTGSEAEKYLRLREAIQAHGTGIIYCATRKRVEAVAEVLREWKIRHILYHGGLDDAGRESAQNRFISREADVAVATNAFGMGIDRPDIRFVTHFEIPGSLEAYYQEIGRAGRDGEPAVCEMLFNYADTRVQEFFIQGSNPSRAFIAGLWEWLRRSADAAGELRVAIREMAAAQGNEKNEMETSSALSLLDRAGVIDRFEVPGQRVRGTRILQPDLSASKLPVDWDLLEEKERRDREKLRVMVEYAYGRRCRQQTILDYFGERGGEPCQICDNCQTDHAAEGVRDPDAEEALIVQKALSGVARMSRRQGGEYLPRYGRGRIIHVLLGSRSKEIVEAGLDRLTTHGLLKTCGAPYLQALFRELLETGLVSSTGGAYPMLGLTPAGERVMRGDCNYQLRWPHLPSQGAARKKGGEPESAEYDFVLYEDLRRLRGKLAREEGIPAYRIFPDETLRSLARLKPQSREAAMRLRGVGERRAQAYLAPFLEVIRRAERGRSA